MDVVLLGLVTGVVAGAVMARGRLCMNSGLRMAAFERSGGVLRAFAIAVAVQMLALALLVAVGFDVTRIGTFPLSQLVGGLVFGAGMALAGGCIAGILWKTGAGSLATAIAIAGFGAGELLIRGPWDGARKELDTAVSRPSDQTLFDALGVAYEPAAALLGAALLVLLLRRSRVALGWGLALGAVAIGAWLTASAAGHDYGLGFVGTADRTERALSAGAPGDIPFPFYVAAGLIAGAAAATRSGLRWPDRARAARALAGGLAMGVGGTLAHGCNIGNGLTGIPLLSLGSVWATAWMAVGALVTWALVLRPLPGLRGHERARA